ncbi:MAG: glutamyl-tRNA reductase [Chromatiales bacterium]
MPLTVVGINHKSAPVAIRERVAFGPAALPQALRDLRACPGVLEAAILSTCNRTELYCNLDTPANDRAVAWLLAQPALGATELSPYLYRLLEQEAVRHLLRVACGLDSMVVGEPQILGQLKDAYHSARAAGAVGRLLNKLFQHAFFVAKKVRTDTAIGSSPVSVAFAAVRLAQQIHGDLADKTALLIGAGEMIELAANHLQAKGLRRLLVANRSLERAQGIAARFAACALPLHDIPLHLAEADVVIASTASPDPILNTEAVSTAMGSRHRRPMLLVDIAVPRNIETRVGELEDIYLYTIDDLQAVIAENLRTRLSAVSQAQEIIDTEAQQLVDWMQRGDAVAVLRALRAHGEAVRDETLAKATRRLELGMAPQEVLQFLASTLTNRLIHAPTVRLKEAGPEGREDFIATVLTLFDLKNKG